MASIIIRQAKTNDKREKKDVVVMKEASRFPEKRQVSFYAFQVNHLLKPLI